MKAFVWEENAIDWLKPFDMSSFSFFPSHLNIFLGLIFLLIIPASEKGM